MILLIAIVVGALAGTAASGAGGALAGALFGWLIVRTLRQQREIESLRKRFDASVGVAAAERAAPAMVSLAEAAAASGSEGKPSAPAESSYKVPARAGEPPFRLLAGSRDAPAGALPVSAVVPQLESERARFGNATLGEFQLDAAAARVAEANARQARLRRWLLWAVLIAGVVGLGALVWRLARSGAAPSTAPPAP